MQCQELLEENHVSCMPKVIDSFVRHVLFNSIAFSFLFTLNLDGNGVLFGHHARNGDVTVQGIRKIVSFNYSKYILNSHSLLVI